MGMLFTLLIVLIHLRCTPAPHHGCVIDVMRAAAHGVVEMDDSSCVYLLKYIEYTSSQSFQVKACHDFEIIISEHSRIDHIDHSLLLGGYRNTETCFAHHDRCEHHDKTYYGPVLSCHEYKSFWLTFDHHYITLGWGLYPMHHTWLLYDHGPPHTKYLAARPGQGTRASMALDPTFIQTTLVKTLPPPTTAITTATINHHTTRHQTQSTAVATSSGKQHQYSSTQSTVATTRSFFQTTTKISTTSSSTKGTTTAQVVDGQWGTWWTVTPCSQSCGGGIQVRQRLCDRPRPSNGGKNCTGVHEMIGACNTQSCPVDGNWGSWKDVLACSATCGGGTVVRARLCNNPAPTNGGKHCNGSNHKVETCNSYPCTTVKTTVAPVDGQWGPWRTLVQCSESCGGGIAVRARLCNSPTPAHGGRDCAGDSHATTRCNTQSCPTPTITTSVMTTTTTTSTTTTMLPTTIPSPTTTIGSYVASPFDSLKNSTVCQDISHDCTNPAALVTICSTSAFSIYCKKSCGLCH